MRWVDLRNQLPVQCRKKGEKRGHMMDLNRVEVIDAFVSSGFLSLSATRASPLDANHGL